MQLKVGWTNLSFRYAVISLVAAIVPLILVGGAYDRYATNLVNTLTGERLDRRLAAISSRLSGFFDARFSQLDTLVNYPDLGVLVEVATRTGDLPSDVRSVLEYEADNPDLYGILLFDGERRLTLAFPSQSASGRPYWGGGDFALDVTPSTRFDGGEMIGPFGPENQLPGSVVLLREIPRGHPVSESAPLGWIGLHVRLASITEFLGLVDTEDLVHAVLLAPGGQAYSAVGLQEDVSGRDLVRGPAILPGWQPALVVETALLSGPLDRVRHALIATILLLAVGLVSLFLLLWIRLSRRVGSLIEGSQALASGRLETRLRVEGRDEIFVLAAVFNRMAERLHAVVQARLEAEKLAALGRFATTVAHEIRNPLATLKTSVQALIPAEADPERREILAGIDEEIDRLDDTLQDLLDYARPRPPRPRRMPVRRILRHFETLVGPAMRERKIRLVCLGDAEAALTADPKHIQQILTNLVLNASEAMPDGGTLTLRSSRDAQRVALEVSDTGCGMPPAVVARVTEPFFTTRPEGIGLGLAISRQLVELNSGELAIASRAGQGTTVTLRFPIATEGT